jgi:hypothetical protein
VRHAGITHATRSTVSLPPTQNIAKTQPQTISELAFDDHDCTVLIQQLLDRSHLLKNSQERRQASQLDLPSCNASVREPTARTQDGNAEPRFAQIEGPQLQIAPPAGP